MNVSKYVHSNKEKKKETALLLSTAEAKSVIISKGLCHSYFLVPFSNPTFEFHEHLSWGIFQQKEHLKVQFTSSPIRQIKSFHLF